MSALPLHEGERVLWRSERAKDTDVPPRHVEKGNHRAVNLIYGVANVGMAAYFLYDLMTMDRDTFMAAIWPAVIAFFLFGAFGSFRKVWSKEVASRLPSPLQQTAFFACIVTDRRVLLFNHPDDPVTALDRRSITFVARDYAQGSPALVFRSDAYADSYALMTTEPLGPALQALDAPLPD